MGFTKEDRDNILNNNLMIVSVIADEEYQKRVWINEEGPEWDSFGEAVNDFIGPGYAILEEYRAYSISKEQYEILKEFVEVFDEFSEKYDYAEEFIDSSEWKEIVKMAQKVLIAFDYKKKN